MHIDQALMYRAKLELECKDEWKSLETQVVEALEEEKKKDDDSTVHVSEPPSPVVTHSMPTSTELVAMIAGWRKTKEAQSISNHKGDGPWFPMGWQEWQEWRNLYSHADIQTFGDLITVLEELPYDPRNRPDLIRRRAAAVRAASVSHTRNFHLSSRRDAQSISKFDSTLGYPGEGPHTFDSGPLRQWLELVAATDVSVRAERQKLHKEGLACEAKGGDFEMANLDYIRVFAWLKQSRNPVSEIALFSFNNAIISISDALDKLHQEAPLVVAPPPHFGD